MASLTLFHLKPYLVFLPLLSIGFFTTDQIKIFWFTRTESRGRIKIFVQKLIVLSLNRNLYRFLNSEDALMMRYCFLHG